MYGKSTALRTFILSAFAVTWAHQRVAGDVDGRALGKQYGMETVTRVALALSLSRGSTCTITGFARAIAAARGLLLGLRQLDGRPLHRRPRVPVGSCTTAALGPFSGARRARTVMTYVLRRRRWRVRSEV